MLSELCKELNNWDFNHRAEKYIGEISIANGQLVGFSDKLAVGQYYRVVGSIFNDGIYKRGDEELTDETFDGAVWAMWIPQEVVDLADEIKEWRDKYEKSETLSPYSSESFGGYSYSRQTASDGSNASWKTVFNSRLSSWRKI
jgi:hypothetical protein